MHARKSGKSARQAEPFETSADPIEVFRRAWGTYRKVIRENYMFHREISAAQRKMLETVPGALDVLDLGCGDASQIGDMFDAVKIGTYCGCDLSLHALDEARQNLEPLGKRAELLCRDMLAVLRESPGEHFDVVYSSYVLHHLPQEEKQDFFHECRRVLRGNGMLILADIMREEGETLPDYFDRYIERMDTDWVMLSMNERSSIQEHIRSCDFPEPPSLLQSMAALAGFRDSQNLEKQTWHQAWRFRP
jgi:ubiquinone/menaquinone biosynthesis C-methylase UbiE